MNISSRPRATVVQQANCNALSENSHSSESAAGSNSSSNTSWATHFPLAVSHAPDTLPQGAKSPQVFTPSLEDVPVGPTPTVKSRARVLRKPHPPISIANASTRRWSLFHSFNRDPPSRSSRVRVNLDDDAPFVPALPYHLSFSPSSAPMPPSSYDVSRRFRSSSDNSLHSRRTNVFAGGVGRPSPVARPQDALERLCAELSRVQEGDSHEETKNDTHHLSTAAHPAVVHRNKPLPAPPGFPRVNSDLAPDPPMEMFPTRPQLSYRHSSFTTPSDEQAEYQFGRFSAEPNAGSHPFVYDYARAHRSYTSRSDTRHPQAWSDSDYVSPVENYAHSEAHYYVFQPQYHYPEPHPSSLPAVNAATHCDNSLPLLSSQRSPSQLQAPPKSQHRLSLGKRIKRSLSINFFRKNIDGTSTAPSYPKSDPGHDGAFPRPASIVHPFTPWLQYEPEGDQQRSRPRKLKKRTPSISGSAALAPGSSLTSMSTPALHRSPSIPREPLLAADVRSQDTRPSEQPSPRLAHKHRSKSTPTTFERPNTPPPMPPLPGVVDTTGSVTARATQSQPSTPTSHLVRKLTKRRVRGKKIPSALDDQPDLLPPMRALSPFDLDVKGRRLSDASRSHSAPNLGPADPTSVHHSRYFTFVTESPPSSPLASDSAADGPSHAEFLQMKPLGNTDRPSFLRSQSNRRWTLAVSEAPEEELVEELDRLRDVGWSLGFQGELIRVKDKRVKAQSDDGDPPGQATGINWEKEELEEWLVARKALMVCREIVRTEKSYREGLVRLQRGETLEAPPPLLLQYIPALISASLAFSARLDDDPSPWGVSVAFLGAEDALEVALVAWSGIVGDYFGINVGKSQRQWSVDPKVNEKEKKAKEKEGKTLGPPVLTPVTYSDDGHGRGQLTPLETKGIQGSWRMSMPALSQLLTNPTDLSLSMNRKSRSPLSPITAAIKTPTVQDLAIQPTQRVMRYVLLYKDLLNSTPITSPARALAERALEGATRIAQRCNRAQDNAAFLT